MYKQNTRAESSSGSTAHSVTGSSASSSHTLAGVSTPTPNLSPPRSLSDGPGPSPLTMSPDAHANLIDLDSPPSSMPGENIKLMATLNIK